MNRRQVLQTSAALAGSFFVPKPLAQLFLENGLTKADFGPNFKWGVATASYQIEGAWQEDGKSPSIWDTFAHGKKNIKTGENADVSCDFYHRYTSDLELLKALNFKVFRFSLAWPRLLPDGPGKPNQKGIDFYNRVIDKCLELGLEPWPTLYHWDLPQVLEDKGGWANRDVVDWFSGYTDLATRSFGDRVKNWMVLNEPFAFTTLGYMLGWHAPGKKGLKDYLPAVHHAALVQAEGGRIVRANVPGANVGTTYSTSFVEPKSDAEKHVKAAKRMDAMLNRLFVEPVLGMGYPTDTLPFLKKIEEKHAKPGDMERMKFDFDFIGVQNYFRVIGKKSLKTPVLWANEEPAAKRGIPADQITDMGWEVTPDGIRQILKQFAAYPGIKKIIVTENGAAFPDVVENGAVHDQLRLKYYQDYLGKVLQAKQEGVPVEGYFCWTFLDNFEWAEGFRPRFGLVHVDYDTQVRTVKDSGKWFQGFLKK
ncbi:MAG: beta-glucosidase [Saprospiraceae bacterium]|nr:beta-glucosidase [Saprospiraceae bacterium]